MVLTIFVIVFFTGIFLYAIGKAIVSVSKNIEEKKQFKKRMHNLDLELQSISTGILDNSQEQFVYDETVIQAALKKVNEQTETQEKTVTINRDRFVSMSVMVELLAQVLDTFNKGTSKK